jgi:hypothetical protein
MNCPSSKPCQCAQSGFHRSARADASAGRSKCLRISVAKMERVRETPLKKQCRAKSIVKIRASVSRPYTTPVPEAAPALTPNRTGGDADEQDPAY